MQGTNNIHMVEHKPSGARVPMRIIRIKDGTIDKYQEVTDGRKAFNLKMLEDRWKENKIEKLSILLKSKIPAHINHEKINKLTADQTPVDFAIFFEEYIYALERKLKIPHNKLKSRLFTNG
mgnify:CR=1 FL=1